MVFFVACMSHRVWKCRLHLLGYVRIRKINRCYGYVPYFVFLFTDYHSFLFVTKLIGPPAKNQKKLTNECGISWHFFSPTPQNQSYYLFISLWYGFFIQNVELHDYLKKKKRTSPKCIMCRWSINKFTFNCSILDAWIFYCWYSQRIATRWCISSSWHCNIFCNDDFSTTGLTTVCQ